MSVRHTDPQTSHAAYGSIDDDAVALKSDAPEAAFDFHLEREGKPLRRMGSAGRMRQVYVHKKRGLTASD